VTSCSIADCQLLVFVAGALHNHLAKVGMVEDVPKVLQEFNFILGLVIGVGSEVE
jgi:hypothetical protein